MNDNSSKKTNDAQYDWSIENNLYITGIVALLIMIFAVLIIYFFNIDVSKIMYPCLMRKCFNLDCPGCGGTRAFISLLHGNFLESIYYNAIVPYGVVVIGCFMITNTARIISKGKFGAMKYKDRYAYILIGILILQFILKNMIHIFYGIDLLGVNI